MLKQELRDSFSFVAGHAALDLAATLKGRLHASKRELLARPEDLGRWLAAAGLATAAPVATQADLVRARSLREAIYALAMARVQGGSASSARRALNAVAAGTPAVPRLSARGVVDVAGTARALLVSIARDAIRLFGGEQAVCIRQCEGETCARLFLDTSRAGERRWCSMAACGNKAKVAEFRRRQHLRSHKPT